MRKTKTSYITSVTYTQYSDYYGAHIEQQIRINGAKKTERQIRNTLIRDYPDTDWSNITIINSEIFSVG